MGRNEAGKDELLHWHDDTISRKVSAVSVDTGVDNADWMFRDTSGKEVLYYELLVVKL